MKNRSWKVSVLKRLIISFICILLPIYALSIFIYNNGLLILRQELSNTMASQVSFYLESLEEEVKRIRTLQLELIEDIDIKSMAAIPQALSNVDRIYSLRRIQNRLFAVKNSSIYIDSVSVMLPAAGKVVSHQSIDDIEPDDTYSREFDRFKSIPVSVDANIIHMDDSMFLVVPYPFWYMTKREPQFILKIQLSKDEFQKALKAMVGNPDEAVFFYDMQNQITIASVEENPIHGEILDLIHEKDPEVSVHAEVANVGQAQYMVVYRKSDYFNAVLVKYIPQESVFQSLEKYNVWFFVFTGTALVIIILYSFYLYRFIHKPLSRLARSFKQVKTGNFKIHIEHDHDDEFRFIYQHFNSMVEDLGTLIDQAYKQKMLVQRAEMKQLQSQINPHFLYNSFFILNTMSRIGDYDNLEKFTESLGRYFQFITRNAAEEVTLQKEVDHARVYTEIQALRFSHRIQVDFEEFPVRYSEILVPRLILQPIIENAFEHGLGMKKTDGVLNIRFEEATDKLHIIVENNGEEMAEENMTILFDKLTLGKNRNDEITALQNIHQRLQLKFGNGFGLSFEKGGMGGIKVIVAIPMQREG